MATAARRDGARPTRHKCQEAGADIVDVIASRPNGMRDFVVRDADGHRFTLGRGEEHLRDIADYYGLEPDEIAVDPPWLVRRVR